MVSEIEFKNLLKVLAVLDDFSTLTRHECVIFGLFLTQIHVNGFSIESFEPTNNGETITSELIDRFLENISQLAPVEYVTLKSILDLGASDN